MKYVKFLGILVISLFLFNINVYAAGGCLTDIKIGKNGGNSVSIDGFDPDTFNYSYNVDGTTTAVNVGPVVTTGYKILNKTSSSDLKYGANVVKINVENIDDPTVTCSYTVTINRADARSSDNSLSSLTVGGVKVTLSADKKSYNVNVDSTVKTVEVKAVPTDAKASFVAGYGERTGNNPLTLTGDKTSFEIRVKAENDAVETYSINVLRTDVKDGDATLKSLTVSDVSADDLKFKSTVLEYEIKVANDIKKVTVSPVANSGTATLDYKEEVKLDEGLNEVKIKVTAEDGTEKTYLLKITREPASTDLLIKNLTIESVTIKFDPNTFSYKIKTDLEKLNINVELYNDKANYEILSNDNLIDGSVVKIKVTFEDKEQIYQLKISKEVVSDTTTTTTDNKGFSFESMLAKYEMLIAMVVLGIGLLVLLIAIMTRSKKVKTNEE